jgi:hypothetical protein
MTRCMLAKMLGVGMTTAVITGSASASLVDAWNFNEASSGTTPALNSVPGGASGVFQAGATRTAGLYGSVGAALFAPSGPQAVDVGNSFSASTGITVGAAILPTWNPSTSTYAEIFRKEDSSDRILFSFQNDTNGSGAQPMVGAGPVLSFGLNIGGTYNELDMLLNGTNGGVTLNTTAPAGGVELEDGKPHYVVATYDSSTGVKAIYVDGIVRDSVTVSGTITSGGTADATIGNVGPGGGEPFTGKIDDVRLYNNGLSAAEIAAIPEPTSVSVLALSGILLTARRRQQSING